MAQLPQPDSLELVQLGERIYANECNRRYECLTAWNSGEDFPSLGIGHFIWYQEGQQAPFEETFPALLNYFQSQNVHLPEWLGAGLGADSPWTSREHFLAEFDSEKMGQLRHLLDSTRPQQVSFIVQRLDSALPQILAAAPVTERDSIRSQYYAIGNAHPPYGLYALIDYVHFKGSGVSPGERYLGQGWGLLQVLQSMQGQASTLDNFVAAAGTVLTQRVANAPAERNEQRWLAGWLARLQTYLPQSAALDSRQ